MSIATVIGPTHPGTGVIGFQVFINALVSASHSISPSTTENHTSIITACLCVISGVNKWGAPVAQTMMSASWVNSVISGVCELQLITVAPWFIHIMLRGFQTILLLPIMQTFFQASSMLYSSKSFMTPAGVHGANQLASHIIILPWFWGWNQSTSFSGDIALIIAFVSIWLGRGSCTM